MESPKPSPQPFDAPIWRIHTVCAYAGVSKPHVYRLIRGGQFPKPVDLGGNVRGWRREDVLAWIEQRETATITDEVRAKTSMAGRKGGASRRSAA